MAAVIHATLTPAVSKAWSFGIMIAIPDLVAGDIIVLGIAFDNTSLTDPTVTIDKPLDEVASWSTGATWTNPTSSSGGGLHGRIMLIHTTTAWAAGERMVLLSAPIVAKVSGGYVVRGGTLAGLLSGNTSHDTASISLAAPTPITDGLTIWLVAQETIAIGTLGGPINSATNDTGGATTGGSTTTNIAARMRVGGGTGVSTQAGSVDKGMAYVAIAPAGGTDIQKIAIGDTLLPVDKIYIGNDLVSKIHVGDVLVYDNV